MRLDKFLSEQNTGSRSSVKSFIKNGTVSVNGIIITQPQYQISPGLDKVLFRGKEILYQKYVYYMLHKPAGVVSANMDRREKTVMDLLPEELKVKGLFPVGRLDKDTEGLLLLTNDGELSHRLLSPKGHVSKCYYLEIDSEINDEEAVLLEQGIDIGERKNGLILLTRPAKVKRITDTSLTLTITEGKYHQVKRMLGAINKQVLYLKRMEMGPVELDPDLEKGKCRKLQKEEIHDLLRYK